MASRTPSRGEKSPRVSGNTPRNAGLPRHRREIMNGPDAGFGPTRRAGVVKVKTEGESGRRGIHPLHFFKIIFRSTSWISRAVNILWPVVPAAIAVRYSLNEWHTLKFVLAYIAMVPCANLIGFAGQELARKLPHVMGVLVETTIGSIVEIIMFMVLLKENEFVLLKGAILGSILANVLLCLGACFIASGFRRLDATFHEAITEAGSGMLLTSAIGLAVPAIFEASTSSFAAQEEIDSNSIAISRGVAVLLLISYAVFVWFQGHTHHSVFTEMFEHDEQRDADRYKEMTKDKLTLTECIVALIISVGLVTVIAIILVLEIPAIIEKHNITDPFMGLILVPLVEKAAEHLTALDEAWDNQMNLALAHCVGSTLQTALLNTPLAVIASWGLNLKFALDFEIFDMVMLLLSVITVGNFLRDQKSNYLEGWLCIVVYVAIALAAFYFPEHGGSEGEGTTTETAEHIAAKLFRP